MSLEVRVLVAVLACEYGVDGHSLGTHSLARLKRAVEEFQGREVEVVFIFSAGRLSVENDRLCDLQAAHVRSCGFNACVPPEEGALIWGSKAELHFLRQQQQRYLNVQVVVVSHDYHIDRMALLAKRKVGLVNVTFVRASSAEDPPSLRALVHEKLGLIEAYVPDKVMAIPKWIRRVGLRKHIIRY